MNNYKTQEPLILFGATGMLGSELAFLNYVARFTSTIVLHSSDETRLQGLKDEIEESDFCNDEITIHTTTDIQTACDFGGLLFYAKSVRASRQSREEMLLENAPMAREVGQAIARAKTSIRRVVCVSNPSDLIGLTLLIHSGLSPEQVLSLSALDTLRLRRTLTRRFGVRESDITGAFTLGSHDNAMAPMLHGVRIHGRSLEEMGCDIECFRSIYKEVRKGGINIYKLRGHTAYQSPAVLALQMLMADSNEPFDLPFSRYHHSERFPYSFASLPGRVDEMGGFHHSVDITEKDMPGLNLAFKSIEHQRDMLINEGIIPEPRHWADVLQAKEEKVKIISE